MRFRTLNPENGLDRDDDLPTGLPTWAKVGGAAVAATGLFLALRPRSASAGTRDSDEIGGGGGEDAKGSNYSPVRNLPLSQWSLEYAPQAEEINRNNPLKAPAKALITYASSEDPAAQARFAEMNTKLAELGADLTSYSASDFTYSGGYHRLPVEELWPNIVPTSWVAGYIAQELGYAPWVTSGYRPYEHDMSLDKSQDVSNSQHIWFSALDLTLPTQYQRESERARFLSIVKYVAQQAGEGLKLGWGGYANSPWMLHIDTGWKSRTWNW